MLLDGSVMFQRLTYVPGKKGAMLVTPVELELIKRRCEFQELKTSFSSDYLIEVEPRVQVSYGPRKLETHTR